MLVALLASRRVAMPDTKRAAATRLDLLGLSLLSPALAATVYGLAQAGTHGSFSDNHVLITVAVGAVLLLGFVVHALHSRTEPIIDLRLFRARSFSGSSAVARRGRPARRPPARPARTRNGSRARPRRQAHRPARPQTDHPRRARPYRRERPRLHP